MKSVDYIVVGCGLASIAFCEQLRNANKTFLVFDDDSQKSSSVAAGLYNPVILKRFTPVWMAKQQLELAMPYYHNLEKLLNTKLNYPISVRRKFLSVEEQNNWFAASDQPILGNYIQPQVLKNLNSAISAPFGLGKVLHSGRINTKKLIASYREFLNQKEQLISKTFNYQKLIYDDRIITYENFSCKYVVFAEGYNLKFNPYFENIPLVGLKGEMLIIESPELKLDYILKSSVFIVPIEDDLYWVGATYEREDKTHNISDEAKEQLLNKLKTVVSCNFKIVSQVAGIRPTTKDRRPLVGRHSKFKNLFILNGMGTRGVMTSPYIAMQLFKHIELNEPLDGAINIKRFKIYK